MSKRSALALVIIAGGVLPTAGYAQLQKKREVLDFGATLTPVRVAKARLINGQAVMIGDWIPYVAPNRPGDLPETSYFDCYEADPTGLPTGFCDSGCNQLGFCPVPASSRWWGGATYVNPFTTNDMTILPAAAGGQATRTRLAWNWGPTFPTQCIVAVFTAETFNDCVSGPPGSAGDFDGVLYDYGAQAGGTGYFYADNDLSATPLFHQMPLDGSGAYSIVLANFVDPISGALTLETAPGTQVMIWGTGDAETPPDGRVGTQDEFAWDDDAPTDGMHTAVECYFYAAAAGQCPDPLGPMIQFMGEEPGGGPVCYPNCDGSTQPPILNVADFGCFLTKFAAGDTYANCDGSTQPPILNVADFGCFLTKFAAGCP